MATRTFGPGSGSSLTTAARIRASIEFTDAGGLQPFTLDDLYNAYSVRAFQVHNLDAGANTIVVPPTGGSPSNDAGGVFIIPPSGSAVTITLKGVSGDTGIPLSRKAWAFIPFDYDGTPQGPASIVLTAASYLANVLLVWV